MEKIVLLKQQIQTALVTYKCAAGFAKSAREDERVAEKQLSDLYLELEKALDEYLGCKGIVLGRFASQ